MRLVLGLGNPGARYVRTRHNVGWRVVEQLVERWEAGTAEQNAAYRSWQCERDGQDVVLMVPLTYMNLSGEAVNTWRERHVLSPDELMVVTDDVYLPVGSVRLRARGSTGGHRGLESIEAELETPDYPRLRIGVGAAEQTELRDHVLTTPSRDEEQSIEESIGFAADAVACWVAEGIDPAMNRFNRKAGKEVSES